MLYEIRLSSYLVDLVVWVLGFQMSKKLISSIVFNRAKATFIRSKKMS